MTNKNKLAIILSFCILLTTALVCVSLSGCLPSVITGDCIYTLVDDDHYVVTGAEQTDCVTLIISETHEGLPVTGIGEGAFRQYHYLQKVHFAKSVKTIGDEAFYGCLLLNNVQIPDGVTAIGNSVFEGCRGLTKISLPDSITSIGDNAFDECWNLTKIKLPKKLVSIGNKAFVHCEALRSITLPDGVKSVGEQAFGFCKKLSSAKIPDSVTEMGNSVFTHCESLANFTIPAGISKIYGGMFACSGLTQINIPAHITEIGGSAFSDCKNLKSVVVPANVTAIGSTAFSDCENLSSITLPDTLTSIGSYAFFNTPFFDNAANWQDGALYIGKYLIAIQKTTVGSFAVKDGTKLIADRAFAPGGVTDVEIPASVTYICYRAFSECRTLQNVTFAKTNGWSVSDPDNPTPEEISAESLQDAANAARQLTETYCYYDWHNSGN